MQICDATLGGSQKCDHLWQGGGRGKKSWNSCDVIYGWPPTTNTILYWYYSGIKIRIRDKLYLNRDRYIIEEHTRGVGPSGSIHHEMNYDRQAREQSWIFSVNLIIWHLKCRCSWPFSELCTGVVDKWPAMSWFKYNRSSLEVIGLPTVSWASLTFVVVEWKSSAAWTTSTIMTFLLVGSGPGFEPRLRQLIDGFFEIFLEFQANPQKLD